jgi:magnesium-transporting ATPase (P-type)
VVLPLLATQILWINLVTDGPPALAPGVDPADDGLMDQPPRPPRERVITARMWSGIVFVAVIMAAGTLFVLDAYRESSPRPSAMWRGCKLCPVAQRRQQGGNPAERPHV